MKIIHKKTIDFQNIITSVYVIIFCFCTTIGTCAAIPEITMRVLTFIIIALELGYITFNRRIQIYKVNGAWFVFFNIIFISIFFKASIFSLITLNLLAGLLFLLIPLYEFDCFAFSIKFLVFFALINAFGVFVQFIGSSLWAPVYQFLTARTQYSTSEMLQYNIRYGGYGYLSGFCYNAGFTAIYLVNGIIGVFFFQKSQKLKGVILLILFMALILTGKRGQLFALVGAMIIAYPMVSTTMSKKAKRVFIIVGAMLSTYVIGLYIYINYSAGFSNSIKRVFSFVYAGEISSSGRDVLAGQSKLLFLKNPITGVGWRNLTPLIGNEPHNSYLQILTETGVFGLLMVIIALTISLYYSLKHFKILNSYSDGDKKLRIVYYGILCFEIYFFVLSFVENTFCNIEFYYMLFLILTIERVYYNSKKRLSVAEI